MKPTNLGDAGRALWDVVLEAAPELSPSDKYILLKVCRLEDTIAELENEQKERELIAHGSMGQEIISPLITEIRQYTALATSTLRQLKIPDTSIDRARDKRKGTGRFDSQTGTQAAQKKWGAARVVANDK